MVVGTCLSRRVGVADAFRLRKLALRYGGVVVFFDEAGEPVLAIEELDSVASAALNRLGGTARTAMDAAA